MNRQRKLLGLVGIAMLLLLPAAMRLTGQEQVAPPREVTDREIQLEYELNRMRNRLAGMGENHPLLKATQEKVTELQAELISISRGQPFAQVLVADRAEMERLLEQMDEKEVRQAILHLFGAVKDLQRRVDRLEERNAK